MDDGSLQVFDRDAQRNATALDDEHTIFRPWEHIETFDYIIGCAVRRSLPLALLESLAKQSYLDQSLVGRDRVSISSNDRASFTISAAEDYPHQAGRARIDASRRREHPPECHVYHGQRASMYGGERRNAGDISRRVESNVSGEIRFNCQLYGDSEYSSNKNTSTVRIRRGESRSSAGCPVHLIHLSMVRLVDAHQWHRSSLSPLWLVNILMFYFTVCHCSGLTNTWKLPGRPNTAQVPNNQSKTVRMLYHCTFIEYLKKTHSNQQIFIIAYTIHRIHCPSPVTNSPWKTIVLTKILGCTTPIAPNRRQKHPQSRKWPQQKWTTSSISYFLHEKHRLKPKFVRTSNWWQSLHPLKILSEQHQTPRLLPSQRRNTSSMISLCCERLRDQASPERKGYLRIRLFFGPHYLSKIPIQEESVFPPEWNAA